MTTPQTPVRSVSPDTSQCLACFSVIDARAKRCPHCTERLVESDAGGWRVVAGILALVATGFVGFGWWRLVNYDDITDNIVGGDAYNYIILALHGVGFISIGIALATIGCICAVLGAREAK